MSKQTKTSHKKPFPRRYWIAAAIIGATGFILGIAVTRKRKNLVNTLDNQSASLNDLLQQREAKIANLNTYIANLEQRLAEFERGLLRSPTILSEDIHVRQIEGEPRRRWFSDMEFDLIVWFNKGKFRSSPKKTSTANPKSQESRVVKKIHSIYGDKDYGKEPERIIGFQLCYDKTGSEKALTWQETTGYSHHVVDTGEEGGESKKTPLLVANGNFEPTKIAELFQQHSVEINPQIAKFVYEKIVQYSKI